MTDAITIRSATNRDRVGIRELAELDGRPAPAGEMLLGEVGGRLWAAIGVEDGAVVADPFEPTHQVVRLLEMRREQERIMRGPGPLLGRLMTARQHAGAIA
jgi:hypothetical protein